MDESDDRELEVPSAVPVEVPLEREQLAYEQREHDAGQGQGEPGDLTGDIEGVDGDHIEDYVTKVGRQRNDVEEDITEGEEFLSHSS